MTLLESLQVMSEAETVQALRDGSLTLSGNFRGHEAEVVAEWESLDK